MLFNWFVQWIAWASLKHLNIIPNAWEGFEMAWSCCKHETLNIIPNMWFVWIAWIASLLSQINCATPPDWWFNVAIHLADCTWKLMIVTIPLPFGKSQLGVFAASAEKFDHCYCKGNWWMVWFGVLSDGKSWWILAARFPWKHAHSISFFFSLFLVFIQRSSTENPFLETGCDDWNWRKKKNPPFY